MIYDYMQPDSDVPVINGQKLFRIQQYMACAGDIWESKQGSHAIAVGPNSDFAGYQVAYWDAQIPTTRLSQLLVTPDRPFAGLIFARNDRDGTYEPAGRPGRILIYPTGNFNEAYRPSGFTVADTLLFEYPVVDVIQYFSDPGELDTARADKVYAYEQLPFGADDCFVLIPYYGRQYGFVDFTNNLGVDVDVTISGLQWTTDITTGPGPRITQLLAPATVADQANLKKVITAAVDGTYDYLQLQFSPGGAIVDFLTSLSITVSDNQG